MPLAQPGQPRLESRPHLSPFTSDAARAAQAMAKRHGPLPGFKRQTLPPVTQEPPIDQPIEPPVTQSSIPVTQADPELLSRIARTLKQIELVNVRIDIALTSQDCGDECKHCHRLPFIDPVDIERLARAKASLEEQARVLAGRPMPGSLRPTAAPSVSAFFGGSDEVDRPA